MGADHSLELLVEVGLTSSDEEVAATASTAWAWEKSKVSIMSAARGRQRTYLCGSNVVPGHLESSLIRSSEDVEERRREVEITVVTGRAFVLDGRGRSLAVGGDLDLLSALGTGVAAAVPVKAISAWSLVR